MSFAQSPKAGPIGEHGALERNSSPDTKGSPRRARALYLTGVLHSTVYKAQDASFLWSLSCSKPSRDPPPQLERNPNPVVWPPTPNTCLLPADPLLTTLPPCQPPVCSEKSSLFSPPSLLFLLTAGCLSFSDSPWKVTFSGRPTLAAPGGRFFHRYHRPCPLGHLTLGVSCVFVCLSSVSSMRQGPCPPGHCCVPRTRAGPRVWKFLGPPC